MKFGPLFVIAAAAAPVDECKAAVAAHGPPTWIDACIARCDFYASGPAWCPEGQTSRGLVNCVASKDPYCFPQGPPALGGEGPNGEEGPSVEESESCIMPGEEQPTAAPPTVAPTLPPVTQAPTLPTVPSTPVPTQPLPTAAPTAAPTQAPPTVGMPKPDYMVGIPQRRGEAPSEVSPSEAEAVRVNKNYPTIVYTTWNESMRTVEEMQQALEAKQAALGPMFKRMQESMRRLPVSEVEKITPGRAENPSNVKRVESICDSKCWSTAFPVRHKVNTYENFLRAVGMFPDYCRDDTAAGNDDEVCRHMLSVSFAHYVQETSYRGHLSAATADEDHRDPLAIELLGSTPLGDEQQGLWHQREMGHAENDGKSDYVSCSPLSGAFYAELWPCVPGKNYFGRGSKQLSHHYNYGPFSSSVYNDRVKLLEHPELVADTWLALASGIWFAVTPQAPKPAMTWVVDGSYIPNEADKAAGVELGFGLTTNIINGGLECGFNSPAANNRITFYKHMAGILGYNIAADDRLDCLTGNFSPNGSASMMSSWAWDVNKKDCEAVSWTSPWAVTTPGAYEECYNLHTRSVTVLNGKIIMRNFQPV